MIKPLIPVDSVTERSKIKTDSPEFTKTTSFASPASSLILQLPKVPFGPARSESYKFSDGINGNSKLPVYIAADLLTIFI